MIPKLPGWQIVDEADGEVALAAKDASLRYVERNRPVRAIQDLVETVLGRRATHEGLITCEGEYAAIARELVSSGGVVVQRSVGVVLGDDFYSLVDASCSDPARFADRHAEVATLVYHDALGLGVRRRRARHVGPAGWSHRRRGLADSYEHGSCRLRVFPANPSRAGVLEAAGAFRDELLREGLADARESVEELELGCLSGVVLDLGGTLRSVATRHAIAILDDGRYLYVIREDGPAEEFSRGALLDAVRTVESIPLPVIHSSDRGAAFAHWSE